LPPIPPFADGRNPVTDVARLILGESPVAPVWLCPVVALNAACNWLNSVLSGGAVIGDPLIIEPVDCLV
jgi:hypothetical protein